MATAEQINLDSNVGTRQFTYKTKDKAKKEKSDEDIPDCH